MDAEKLNRNERILRYIGSMTSVELSHFVADFKGRFSVGGLANAAAEFQDNDTSPCYLMVEDAGELKIQVIKLVRELASLPLKQSKDVSEGMVHPPFDKLDRDTALDWKHQLEKLGATVKLVPLDDRPR